MGPLIGTEIDGRYRIVQELGEGAMGVVYKADRIGDDQGQVAIKVLNESCSSQPDLRERFEREARALFGLQHSNILEVQDFGVTPETMQPYLVMELLEGQSLDAMIDDEKLDLTAALDVGRQLIRGLAHAHSQGVLHRDLKTENVFVVRHADGSLQAKLLDFGLVKFVDDERWGEGRKLTVAGSVMGSPAYMSPEQGTGAPTDARSDVYSVGVVLYELITGDWPFSGESRVEMLKAHLLEPVPTLAAGREGLSVRPELDAVIQKALAKDADDRFVDAVQMLAALEAVPQPAAWLTQRPGERPPLRGGALPALGALDDLPVAQPLPERPASIAQAAPVLAPQKPSRKLPLVLAGGLVAFCALSVLATAVALWLVRVAV